VLLALSLAAAASAVTLILRPRSLPPPPLVPPRLIAPHPVLVPDAARANDRPVEGGAPGAARPDERPAENAALATARAVGKRPKVAIVIDDLGDSVEAARAVLALEPAVTVAVLPFRAASVAVAAAAIDRGREVILHLPLEPERASEMDGGAAFLRTGMPPARLEERLEMSLRAVPYIVGVNGHMGSRFTRDGLAMEALLGALRARGLFFLDSRTSPASVAAPIARRIGLPFAERSLFLDHHPAATAVGDALSELAATARVHGEAIGVGHPRRATIAALDHWLRAAASEGLDVVPLSALVH
jgi:hypothetical protein